MSSLIMANIPSTWMERFDPEQDSLGCGYLLLHRLALADKIFGDIQPFDPFLQRSPICLFCVDALLFDRTFLAALTFVDGYLLDITCFGFPRLYRRCPQLPTLRAGIFVFFRIVIHIFSAANIRLVFALLFLLVI